MNQSIHTQQIEEKQTRLEININKYRKYRQADAYPQLKTAKQTENQIKIFQQIS